MSAIIPQPRCPITIRPATIEDYAFIDRLQAMHSKALGFMPKAQLQGKITRGEVLIAEGEAVSGEAVKRENDRVTASPLHCVTPLGYCMSSDRYFKRDELGVIYQMNIAPPAQRKLVAASLLKEVFERAPYGCKLFCCWCAQDLPANAFWESLGFVPLAFRAGAKGKRAHIFWQKRIREGDTTTPYWFPAKTDGGSMREDRLVLPIPPGVHWSDPMPILLPVATAATTPRALPNPTKKDRAPGEPKRRVAKHQPLSGLAFTAVKVAAEKRAKVKREKIKADPAHVAKARELRDRYLEQFNAGLVLPGGKYEVTRQIESKPPAAMKALAA